MSRADIYGESREAALYDEGIERPGSNRISGAGSAVLNALGEAIFRSIPRADPRTTPGQIVNGVLGGAQQKFHIQKHAAANVALSTEEIPGLKHLVKSGWAYANLLSGLTDIDAAFTVERGGREHILGYGKPGSIPDVGALQSEAYKITGYEPAHRNLLTTTVGGKGIPPDRDATTSGVYSELTNNDVKVALDLSKFQPAYSRAELWFIGRKGRRSVIGQTPVGEKIVMYQRPSSMEFLKYYTRLDGVYTIIDTVLGATEKALGGGIAKQKIYETEVDNSIRNVCRHYGNTRDDGLQNPFSYLMPI